VTGRSRTSPEAVVRIEPWGPGDLHILEKSMGRPEMTTYIGGPESPEKLAERHARYERPGSRQYKIVDVATGEGIGWVGYWERMRQDRRVFETGWSVLPGHQGRGIASTATAQLLEKARAEGSLRYVHAYPSVENAPSNAICRKLGFTLMGEHDFEFPPGNWMRCNDWRFDLGVGE
jgi:RimJ/RimL family protein N-acetyltransferase